MNRKIKNNNINLKIFNNKIFSIFIYYILFLLLLLPLWLNKKFGFLYFEQFKFNLTLLYYGYLLR